MKLHPPAPNVREQFPREIRTIEHAWIPLRDGARLAARIWLPIDAEADPVPAVLEYIPYRKNDGTIISDVLEAPLLCGARVRQPARRSAWHRRFGRRHLRRVPCPGARGRP